jgi:hypothetical protein
MSDDTTTPTPDASEPELPKFKYGFIVLVSEDGSVYIEKDGAQFSLPVEREATLLEIRRYTSEILMDLQAQSAAEYTSMRLIANKEEPKP